MVYKLMRKQHGESSNEKWGLSEMDNCNHKWINMEDGTLDKFCVRCRKFAMQAHKTINAKEPELLTKTEFQDIMAALSNEINKKTQEGSLGQSIFRGLRR